MILNINTLLLIRTTIAALALTRFGQAHAHGGHNQDQHDHHHHASLRALQGNGNGNGGNPWKGVDFCGTKKPDDVQQATDMAVVDKWKEKNKDKDGNRALQETVTIDVYMILIHPKGNKNANEIIFNNNAQAQIDVLNGAYSPHFSFNLKGVKVVENSSWWNIKYGSSAEKAMKQKTRTGVDCKTLNMWYTQLSNGLLGWATFPTECSSNPYYSGVVNLHSSAMGGSLSPYNKGDTATHEVGHWLGL
jgi:hypothetical protein